MKTKKINKPIGNSQSAVLKHNGLTTNKLLCLMQYTGNSMCERIISRKQITNNLRNLLRLLDQI